MVAANCQVALYTHLLEKSRERAQEELRAPLGALKRALSRCPSVCLLVHSKILLDFLLV